MKTICLYARAGQNILYAKLGPFFRKNGFEPVFVVNNKKEKEIVSSYNSDSKVYILMDYIKNNWFNTSILDKKSISDIEKEYAIDSIWRLFYVDRFLVKYNYEDAVKLIKLHFAFSESIFNENKPIVFINEIIAVFSAYVFYVIKEKYSCKYMGLNSTQYSKEMFYISYDNKNKISNLEKTYLNKKLNENDISVAKEYIQNIREKHTKSALLSGIKVEPVFRISIFKRLFKFIINFIFTSNKNKFNYEFDALNILQTDIRYFKYQIQRKYYKQPNYKQNYILFPLHYQPEATTLTFASFFEKQLFIIDILAKSIPGDCVLYVKEHYAKLGHRELDFYRKLKKYPNIRLINPLIDSHELIINSKAVVVLTSFVGFESLIFKKPVYVLGDVFYSSFKYIRKIDNIYNITSELKDKDYVLNIDDGDYENELEIFVASYIKSLHKGRYLLSNNITDDNNIENIFNSLIKELN